MEPTPSLDEIENILLHAIPGMLPQASGPITPDSDLQSLGLDSLVLLELIIFIEKKFGISLLDAPLNHQDLENIRSLSRHITRLLQA